MADVVLVKLDGEEKEYRIAPPFGILYLADALEKAGFSVRLIHELGTEADIQTVAEVVTRERPLFVGFSTMTGPSLLPTAQASKAVKETQPVLVVWGGLHPTMLPQQTLMNDFVDIVAIGEGERTTVELAGVLREYGPDDEEMTRVAGLALKRNGNVILTKPRSFITDLDDLHPAWHHVDITRYFRSGQHCYTDVGSQFQGEKIAAVFTSRGCPWRCGFCYNQFVNKRAFRPQSAQRVIRDIQQYREQYGVTAIIFEDDCFFANKDRALEIIHHMDIAWTCSIRANYLVKWGDDFVRDLSQHNCAELRIGAESGSQWVLDRMHKDITVDQIRTAAALCLKHGVKASLGFMVGIPGESWSDVVQTLDLMDELEQMGNGIEVIGPCIFTPYPGTPLFEQAIEHGFEPPASLEEWGGRLWGHRQPLASYADRRIRFVAYYRRLAQRADLDQLTFSLPVRVLRQVARLRWRHRFFRFPLDYTLPAFGLDMLTKFGLVGWYGTLRKATWRS
jgi:anaerobic magnesium-protoporphyrin IX monomethyl ester cyclase